MWNTQFQYSNEVRCREFGRLPLFFLQLHITSQTSGDSKIIFCSNPNNKCYDALLTSPYLLTQIIALNKVTYIKTR